MMLAGGIVVVSRALSGFPVTGVIGFLGFNLVVRRPHRLPNRAIAAKSRTWQFLT